MSPSAVHRPTLHDEEPVYAAAGPAAARAALNRFYRWSDGVQVAELSRLARTVRAWEAEILAWHATGGCSNGPTEALTCWSKRSSASDTASATSPTTAWAATALRRQVADSPHRKATRPLTTLGGEEPPIQTPKDSTGDQRRN
jgi:Transposase